jgi:SAM-dependent methyltransferase
MESKTHWENIYSTKAFEEVSWYQKSPENAIAALHRASLSKDAKIIDIGGGDSFFVDYLIEAGYRDITVLDISQNALDRAKSRLGKKRDKVTWICSDITHFQPEQTYDFWYDRAVLHFLRNEEDQISYKKNLLKATAKNSFISLAAFAKDGPLKCSGIEVQQYDPKDLELFLGDSFETLESFKLEHPTPFGTVQQFSFLWSQHL